METIALTKRRVQNMATQLRTACPSAKLSHQAALDAVARTLGYADYNTLKPSLKDNKSNTYTVVMELTNDTHLSDHVIVEAASRKEAETKASHQYHNNTNILATFSGAPTNKPSNPDSVFQPWTALVRAPDNKIYPVHFQSEVNVAIPRARLVAVSHHTHNTRPVDTDPGRFQTIYLVPGTLFPADTMNTANDTELPRVMAIVKGGVLQDVISTAPLRFITIDYDNLSPEGVADTIDANGNTDLNNYLPHENTPDAILSPYQFQTELNEIFDDLRCDLKQLLADSDTP